VKQVVSGHEEKLRQFLIVRRHELSRRLFRRKLENPVNVTNGRKSLGPLMQSSSSFELFKARGQV